MSERTYRDVEIDLDDLADAVVDWFEHDGFEVQDFQEGPGIFIQARKQSLLNRLSATGQALNVRLSPLSSGFRVQVSAGEWLDKGIGAAAALALRALSLPLALGAGVATGFGIYQQLKLPEQLLEFIDLFVAIGRLGRSLGLHLLLASQRLEEGRLRGLESHLSYRIGLRTFSAGESRTVLGVPDAYELPADPGLGYLRPDPATLLRFRAAHVSGPPRGRTPVRREDGGSPPGILPFTVSEVLLPDAARPAPDPAVPEPPVDRESVLDLAVRRMAGRGPAAHQVWLPPLDQPDPLGDLMPDLVAHPTLGLVSRRWRDAGRLVVPLGTIDRPREQRRDTLTVDLAGAGGHAVVVGGPRSGKSTLLRTLVAGIALTTTPQ